MKKKLLFMALFAFTSLTGFAQATAYDVPDLTICSNSAVFDLTVQTPIALGSQSANDYSVTYFYSQANAEANTNQIVNPAAFYSPNNDEIFIRVSNNSNGDFDITSFDLSWNALVTPWNDVNVCTSYTLPNFSWPIITYYTGPNATGSVIAGGSVITASQTIYVVQAGICNNEWDFDVTVTGALPDVDLQPIVVCDENFDGFATFYLEAHLGDIWSLIPGYPDLEVQLFETEADAQNETNPIWNYIYTNTTIDQQIIYVRLTSQECVSIEPLILIASPCVTDNIISGIIRYDSDYNGCSDTDLAAAGITVYYYNDNNYYYTTTDDNGNYSFANVPDGPVSVHTNGLYQFNSTVTPQNYSFTFPGVEEDVNFCLTEQVAVTDAEVYTFMYNGYVPGFLGAQVIAVHNTGSVVIPAGNVTLTFDNSLLTYTSATQPATVNGNELSFAYASLQPYQTQYIYINFNVSTTAVSGNELDFTAAITTADDEIDNNTYDYTTYVVSSFDPNDISVREGETITEEQVDDYLHYTIRFQNMGDANASFVRIVTDLNENLDLETFQPIGASHNYVANRTANSLEFFFDDINLPFESADEPGSHGFVTFKIKPKATVIVGDEMTGQAGIYFDYNPVVNTNITTTTVQATAGIKAVAANSFIIYPNPAHGRVALQLQNTVLSASVTITDVLGKTVQKATVNGTQASLDVSALKAGVYFVSLNTNGKQATNKLVIK